MDEKKKERTSGETYDFITGALSTLKENESINVIMKDRVYKVTYQYPKDNVVLFKV